MIRRLWFLRQQGKQIRLQLLKMSVWVIEFQIIKFIFKPSFLHSGTWSAHIQTRASRSYANPGEHWYLEASPFQQFQNTSHLASSAKIPYKRGQWALEIAGSVRKGRVKRKLKKLLIEKLIFCRKMLLMENLDCCWQFPLSPFMNFSKTVYKICNNVNAFSKQRRSVSYVSLSNSLTLPTRYAIGCRAIN